MSISDNIKKILVERHMKQSELSRLAGLPNTSVQNIFSEVTRDPKVMMLNAIANALGVTLYDLIGYGNSEALHKEFYKKVILEIESYAEKHQIPLNEAKKKFLITELYQFATQKAGKDPKKMLEIDTIYMEWLFKSSV